jgi:clan AA aspartic protease (TIGR02281 family)
MEPEQVKAPATKRRLLRFTVWVVVASAVMTGLVAWTLGGQSTQSTRAASHTSTHSSSTLFYHASSQMSFPRSGDGRYHLDTEMNERQVRFVVDPGTPTVMLSLDDARTAGIDTQKLSFSGRATTPDGEMRVAPVVIPMLTLKQLTLFNVSGVVAEGSLPTSILGLGFLKRFDSYEMRDEELVLSW